MPKETWNKCCGETGEAARQMQILADAARKIDGVPYGWKDIALDECYHLLDGMPAQGALGSPQYLAFERCMKAKLKEYENQNQGSCVYCAERMKSFMDSASGDFSCQCWKYKIIEQRKFVDVDYSEFPSIWQTGDWITWLLTTFGSHTFMVIRADVEGYDYAYSPGALAFDGWTHYSNIEGRCRFTSSPAYEMYNKWPYPTSHWEYHKDE